MPIEGEKMQLSKGTPLESDEHVANSAGELAAGRCACGRAVKRGLLASSASSRSSAGANASRASHGDSAPPQRARTTARMLPIASLEHDHFESMERVAEPSVWLTLQASWHGLALG